MALDISFISDFHRNLYQAAPQNNEEAAREAWKVFSSTHSEWQRYGDHWIKSRAAGSGPLKLGIPWINYPSIDFLKQFLKGKSTAFEWGMGGSTIFLRRYVPTVISVEHDQKWFVEAEKAIESAQLNRFKLRNFVPRYRSRCILIPPKDGNDIAYRSELKAFRNKSFRTYVQSIRPWPDQFFDLVLVDGRARTACCKEGSKKVRPGGILMLDNSDYTRYQYDLSTLERTELAGWEKVELLGPGPCSGVIGWKTTVWKRPK